MRTSHLKIAARIREKKQEITDEEFFSSQEFEAYLTDITEKMCSKRNRKIEVKTIWDETPGAFVARTDNRTIEINCGNEIVRSLPTRALRAECIRGSHSHELGHIFYTSFPLTTAYTAAMYEGKIYPSDPKGLTDAEDRTLGKLKELLSSDNRERKYGLLHIAHDIHNLLEDVYIEERMCFNYPGLRYGIELIHLRYADLCPSLSEVVKKDVPKYTIMFYIMNQYCVTGTINNLGGLENEYLDRFRECIPLIEKSVYNPNAKSRFDAVNRIMLLWWDYIDEYLDTFQSAMEEKREAALAAAGAGLASGSGEPGEISESDMDKVLSKLDGDVPRRSEMPDDTGGAVKEAYKPDIKAAKEAHDVIKGIIEHELPKHPDGKEDGSGASDEGERFETDTGYEDADYKAYAEDIERMLSAMAKEKVHEEMESELEAELRKDARELDYGSLSSGMCTTLYRKSRVDLYAIENYERIAPPLLRISKEMQKKVRQVIKDQETGGKRSGLYMGRHFDIRSVVRDDGRLFYNRKSPCDNAQLCVVLLVDESGSMAYGNRAMMARFASIAIYDFCNGLGIPIAIVGHSGDQVTRKSMELYSYADFHSIDGNDKYRLMDITARYQNRDGAALRFASDMIAKRQEPYKLLFVISDGAPAAIGYGGISAENEMREVIRTYARKGVITFGAAIGEDRDDIKRIYGEDFFLDVTDLNELPRNISALIAKYVKISA